MLLLASTTPAAAAAPGATPTNLDYCLAQCLDIMPPGQNGNATIAQILAHQAFGTRPPHSDDQLPKYEGLLWAYPTVTEDGLQDYFNASSFGAPAGGVESTFKPRLDVTIYREKATGIPHVRGLTRSGTIFGAGYASAGDRLFLMDALRHVGRGELTSFAGGSPDNRELEQGQFRAAPYTEAELQRQFDQLDNLYGAPGKALQDDITAYVAGINRYIDLIGSENKLPGEYIGLGRLRVEPWKVTDVVATASLVGGALGQGGGEEVSSALALVEARARYGQALGDQTWEVLRSAEDPEAPTTVHNGDSFEYGAAPPDAPGRVLPEQGSVVEEPLVTNPTGSANDPGAAVVSKLGNRPVTSNALLVSGPESESGKPLAVFGPQFGYFSPQLTLELDLQGPGISSRGVAFAGISMYVLLGRGQDYAWSATSANQDIVDTFAVDLCEPGGGTPTLESMHYRFRGLCLPIDVLTKRNEWRPTPGDPTPAGGYTLVANRTKLGLIKQRGVVDGRPVAFTSLRSTYLHEIDSGIGFSMFNDPGLITSARAFQDAAHRVGFTFNWFYLNRDDIAYFNSGFNPVRAPGADPNLPNLGQFAYEWRGWNPDTNVARYTPKSEHPQGINQDFYTSWNNKQAPGHRASDDFYGYGPIYRSQLLDDRIRTGINGPAKMNKVELVQAMQDAATVDLRGDSVLPLALEVIGPGSTGNAALDDALDKLRDWEASGAHRIARQSPHVTGIFRYDDEEAIQLMDAWWPRWVDAQFKAGLGDDLFDSILPLLPIDDPPGAIGSAYQAGWWGYVSKDLRSVLGQPVGAPFPQDFCGGGNLAACRQMLIDTLTEAMAVPATELYPASGGCAAGDQFCHDQIVHVEFGGIGQERMEWMNRPTYQQVIEFPARRGDNIANLALGGTATASTTFIGRPASNAIDGDPSTKWQGTRTPQADAFTVDLGSAKSVARVVADWATPEVEDYVIEVSTLGLSWTQVASVTEGGDRDVVRFNPRVARYVRISGAAATPAYSLYELGIYAR